MSLVPVRNVWLIRQQNIKGSSSSTTDGSKSNQNASTNAGDPTSMTDVADDNAWPQVNINSPSKIKEKAKEKGVLSPSATTNEIVTDSSPKKGDKGKPKWVPITLSEASPAPLPNSIGSSVPTMTSNHASPRPQSPISVPTTSSVDTSVVDDTLGLNAQVAATDLHIEPRIEEQWPSVPTLLPQLQRQLSPQPERPLKPSSPHLHSTSPSRIQPVILQSYPSFPESSYAYQTHPYPIYDHSSAYPYLPYASSSSSAQYPPYPSESVSYLFPGQMSVPVPPIGQPTGDASFAAVGAATVFGGVEPSHEKRLPPFGVGCADRKGKRRRKDIADGGVANGRRRRRKYPFAVARGSSGNDQIIDLISWSGVGEELQSPVLGFSESENCSQRRNRRRWSFFWDGVHLVELFHYHSSSTHLLSILPTSTTCPCTSLSATISTRCSITLSLYLFTFISSSATTPTTTATAFPRLSTIF
ncbi:hypothetical protein L218DRAFT_189626 [Marasmius fiardii PR-910]|nr:hypothetical protein L218DRAFT_189626 [Marasmius fiardii PR-910]